MSGTTDENHRVGGNVNVPRGIPSDKLVFNGSSDVVGEQEEETRGKATNYADPVYNVAVSDCSSCCPGCEPANVLSDDTQQLWLTHEGLPQHFTLDMTTAGALHPKENIVAFGWYCWHSYTTNPKRVEVSVGDSSFAEHFEFVGTFTASAGAGLQHFSFKTPLNLGKTPYVRLTVLENFGGEQVYINRFYLYGTGKVDGQFSPRGTSNETMRAMPPPHGVGLVSSSLESAGTLGEEEVGESSPALFSFETLNDAQGNDNVFMSNDDPDMKTDRSQIMAMMIDGNGKPEDGGAAESRGGGTPGLDSSSWVEQELASARFYAQSQYLDKETLDWLYEDLDESLPAAGLRASIDALNTSLTPSSSVDSAKSLVLRYKSPESETMGLGSQHPGTVSTNNGTLGVIMHRSGSVEVKVTPPKGMDADHYAENIIDEQYSRTQSTEPSVVGGASTMNTRFGLSKRGPRFSPSRDSVRVGFATANSRLGMSPQEANNSSALFLPETTQEKVAERILASNENERLKVQLDDMQNEIERLVLGSSSSMSSDKKKKERKGKSKSPNRRSHASPNNAKAREEGPGTEHAAGTQNTNLRKKKSMVRTTKGSSSRTGTTAAKSRAESPVEYYSSSSGNSSSDSRQDQLSMENLAVMVEKYNRHVSYLESRLVGAEEHIFTLESTIDELNKQGPAGAAGEGKPREKRRGKKLQKARSGESKRPNPSVVGSKAFRQGVLDVLDAWEKDLVKGVLDPHISGLITKLRKDLFTHVDMSLGDIRNEVKRIRSLVDSKLEHQGAKDEPVHLKPSGGAVQRSSSRKESRPVAVSIPGVTKKSVTLSMPKDQFDAGATIKALNGQQMTEEQGRQYRDLVQKLREKLAEKEKTLEAIEIVRRKSNKHKRKEYMATVRSRSNLDSDTTGKQGKVTTRTFNIGVEEVLKKAE